MWIGIKGMRKGLGMDNGNGNGMGTVWERAFNQFLYFFYHHAMYKSFTYPVSAVATYRRY